MAGLAAMLQEQWRRVCGRHLGVLSDQAYLCDPRAEAAAVLRYAVEGIAAEKRRRMPPAPAPAPPAPTPTAPEGATPIVLAAEGAAEGAAHVSAALVDAQAASATPAHAADAAAPGGSGCPVASAGPPAPLPPLPFGLPPGSYQLPPVFQAGAQHSDSLQPSSAAQDIFAILQEHAGVCLLLAAIPTCLQGAGGSFWRNAATV